MWRRWARPSMMSIARHESLRTVFPDIDGVPFQQVLPARAGMWRRGGAAVVSLPEQEVAGELVGLAGYRFDLSTEIPIRGQIYAVGPGSMWWGLWCTTSLLMAGLMAPLARDVGVAYASSVCRVGRRTGCRWRCSMPITRCGSRSGWGPSLIPTV